LTKKKTHKISADQGLHLLGAIGNVGYLNEHIKYFEGKIPKEIESFKKTDNKSFSQCHNFAAWIRLYSEYVCVKMLSFLHWAQICKQPVDEFYYGTAVAETIKLAKQNINTKLELDTEFETKIYNLKLVVQLRHTLQHGGMPNILRKGKKFKDIAIKDAYNMFIPQNYMKTKNIFESADKLLNMIPAPTLETYIEDIDRTIEIRSAKEP